MNCSAFSNCLVTELKVRSFLQCSSSGLAIMQKPNRHVSFDANRIWTSLEQ